MCDHSSVLLLDLDFNLVSFWRSRRKSEYPPNQHIFSLLPSPAMIEENEGCAADSSDAHASWKAGSSRISRSRVTAAMSLNQWSSVFGTVGLLNSIDSHLVYYIDFVNAFIT